MTSNAPPLPPGPQSPVGPPPPPGPAAARPPLRRSRTDRVLGGVCGGLAEHTGIDALLWRVGFIALVFVGGTGLVVYLALWLLMPAPSATGPDPAGHPAAPAEPRSPVAGSTVAAVLILVGVFALVARTTAWSPALPVYLAGALVVVGVGLVVGAFVGGRSSRGPLIALGVLLSFALVVTSAGSGRVDRGGVGDRSVAPRTVADVQPRYEGGVGDLELDLTGLDLADLGGPVTTEVAAGIGDLDVVVPRSADVRVSVRTGIGEADVFGQGATGGSYAGTGSAAWTGDDVPEIVLTVESGIGDVRVSRG